MFVRQNSPLAGIINDNLKLQSWIGDVKMEYDEELVDIVNENNEVIGKAKRGEAHKKGLIHRALSVLALNAANQILLQQRSPGRSIHPLSWDLSTSEHVLAGETYEEAGERSAREELGIEVKVKKVSGESLQKRKYKLKDRIVYEYEIVCMLITFHEGPFKLDPKEVYRVKFFSVEEIEEMIKNKTKFTPWFLDEWENVKQVTSDK